MPINRGFGAGQTPRRSHLRALIAALEHVRWMRRHRTCVTCGVAYDASNTLHVDPRCSRCAAVLANTNDRDVELGAGD